MSGEQKHITPYQEEADAMFNSALVYELGALKQQAVPLLEEVLVKYPEHSKATRLLKFFSYVQAVPTREIPPASILRENSFSLCKMLPCQPNLFNVSSK